MSRGNKTLGVVRASSRGGVGRYVYRICCANMKTLAGLFLYQNSGRTIRLLQCIE